ncbi:MAG: PD-(D/E)XK nuclease family protein [Elusimicrobiota bacterium]|jgi:RecB family exonuclease|nr:PD-(D/E)XK nuclease family protein [Elusimicrobiota bacterium]
MGKQLRRNNYDNEFKISYSRVNAYIFCPFRYKLIYIDNLHTPVNSDISFGHTIHKTLEQFHSQKGKTWNFLMECYDDSWKSGGFLTPISAFEYYLRGQKMLSNYFNSFKQSDAEILYTEKNFDANIGKYKFVGIIDRIDKYPDGTYEIMDYKTHSKVWNQEKVDKDLQLTFYAYACKTIFGFNPDRICIYFLSQNKKVYTARTQQDIENAINISMTAAEKIAEENWTPNRSHCQQCDFKYKCRNSICVRRPPKTAQKQQEQQTIVQKT